MTTAVNLNRGTTIRSRDGVALYFRARRAKIDCPATWLLIEAVLSDLPFAAHITIAGTFAGNFNVERGAGFLKVLESHAAVIEAFLKRRSNGDMKIGHWDARKLRHKPVLADFSETSESGVDLGIGQDGSDRSSRKNGHETHDPSGFHKRSSCEVSSNVAAVPQVGGFFWGEIITLIAPTLRH